MLLRDTTKPVSPEEAVAGRARATRIDSSGTAAPAASVPRPGVYVYATEGFERIDALAGSRHDYPRRSTITVLRGGCGLLVRWDVHEGRSTTWDYCPSPERWSIRSFTELHRFFGQSDRREYRCERGSIARPPDEVGARWTTRCSTAQTTETANGEVIGIETLTVAGQRVETVHLRLDISLSGATRGGGVIDSWLLRSNGLLVRQVVRKDTDTRSAIGDVHYQERYELTLTDLERRR